MRSRADVERVRAAADPVDVARRAGWLEGAQRQGGGGILVRCVAPNHRDGTASLSLTYGADGALRARCFGCELAGDILDLAAAELNVERDRHFVDVLARAAELAGVSVESDAPQPPPRRYTPPPPRPRTYPAAAEVAALWRLARPVCADVEVTAWLLDRGLDPDAVETGDLARALPKSIGVPRWARYQRRTWGETGHRLIVPMRDARGVVRSVRARAVITTDAPKALPPAGHAMAGLVMACPLAVQVLEAGGWPEWCERRTLVISEGEPDWFTWATRWSDADERPSAVIGIAGSGSWTKELAGRVPDDSEVVIRTDRDSAGEQYARAIAATLADRCRLLRGGGVDGEEQQPCT